MTGHFKSDNSGFVHYTVVIQKEDANYMIFKQGEVTRLNFLHYFN